MLKNFVEYIRLCLWLMAYEYQATCLIILLLTNPLIFKEGDTGDTPK